MDEQVIRQSAPDRFEITVDGEVAGFAQFSDRGNRRVFNHTEIDDRFQGGGLAGTVVRRALEATREEGRSVVPVCSFVKKFVEDAPEWSDLVVEPTPDDLTSHP